MDWNVQLKTAGLNDWIAFMEQRLTRIRDLIDVLETEGKQLKKVWNGVAMRQWENSFQTLLDQLKGTVEEMKKLILTVSEIASVLAQMEKGMVSAAEKL